MRLTNEANYVPFFIDNNEARTNGGQNLIVGNIVSVKVRRNRARPQKHVEAP